MPTALAVQLMLRWVLVGLDHRSSSLPIGHCANLLYYTQNPKEVKHFWSGGSIPIWGRRFLGLVNRTPAKFTLDKSELLCYNVIHRFFHSCPLA
ncbi:MAG: hypothetical protein ACYDBJ_13840 [Aggregatilineales bacterium]